MAGSCLLPRAVPIPNGALLPQRVRTSVSRSADDPPETGAPLFRTVYKITSLATTHATHGASGAVLESYTVKGRVVLVFSSDGLNDTAHAENCCCCGGDEIDKAEFINVNVLAYSLLR